MDGIKEVVRKLLPEGFEPCSLEKKYGRPADMCKECVRFGRHGFVTWEEMDVYGYPTPYSYKCKRYPCAKYPEVIEERKAEVMEHSGIPVEYREKTVNMYKVRDKGTEKAKSITAKFCSKCMKGDCNEWLYLAGQSGSGKTHLACSAGVLLIKNGKTVKMFFWPELMKEIKNFYYDNFNSAKEAEVLILDDLYKGNPTPEEMKRTFELIDYRRTRGMQTIITTERDNRSMNDLDAAVIGRIVEACKGFWAYIPKSEESNYRISEFIKG